MGGASSREGAERASGFSLFKLKKRSQFQRVYNKGIFFKKEIITLCLLENGLSHNRIGVSVTAKKAPGSVRRNRCRRLLYESFRLTEELLKPGYDIIFISNKDISGAKFDEIKSEVVALYKKSGALR